MEIRLQHARRRISCRPWLNLGNGPAGHGCPRSHETATTITGREIALPDPTFGEVSVGSAPAARLLIHLI